MSILSDKDIVDRLKGKYGRRQRLIIEPCQYLHDVQPASVDLHLGNELKTLDNKSIDISEKPYILKGNEFILGATLEYVEIPVDLVGHVDGKSSLGRLGVTAHITAGYIDPNFKGNITLEIKNVSDESFELIGGMDFCQLVLQTLTSPCKRPYGSENLTSHYQNSEGVVLSKYEYNKKL